MTVEPFEIVREVPLSQDETFARLTDWQRHADVLPFTDVRATGTRIVIRTGVGRVGFDDPMDIVQWDPPWFCRLEKRGRVVHGWADICVWPTDTGSKVVWREVAHVTGVPRIMGRVESAVGSALFGRLLNGLTRT